MVFIDVVQTWYGQESLHYVPTAFLLHPYYINYVTTTIVSHFCQGKGTFIPRCIRQHYLCSTFARCLTRPLYVCIKFSLSLWHVKQLSINTSPKFSHFHLCFNFYHENKKIRTFFCNVLCIRATKLCLRLPLCCYGGCNGEGIGDNLDLVGCALGFRVPLPYRQHQHKHWGQVLNCHPFYGLFVFSSDLLEA